MKINLILVGLLCVISSCAVQQPKEKSITLWVNSSKIPCTGVGLMQCIQVQKGAVLEENKWEYFYEDIAGFEYRPGYIYQLKVAVKDVDPSTIPTDASTKKYSLVSIISKEIDTDLYLDNIWLLTHTGNDEFSLKYEANRPRLEIKVSEGKIMGRGVCNRFFGKIELVTKTKLEFGAAIGATKMMCQNMQLEDIYFRKLAQVKSYKLHENSLHLFGNNEELLLQFKKVD